jgi:hypothetical protein
MIIILVDTSFLGKTIIKLGVTIALPRNNVHSAHELLIGLPPPTHEPTGHFSRKGQIEYSMKEITWGPRHQCSDWTIERWSRAWYKNILGVLEIALSKDFIGSRPI